jgi:hypothetical protein
MPLARKFLWIVSMNGSGVETDFSKHALAIGATGVCIRSSSTRLPDAIGRFQALGMKVYGWRWPSVVPAKTKAEADKVVNVLIPAGLDGYIVDPESDGPGSNDWNQNGLGPLAQSFCATIKNAAVGRPFVFGTTSGCAYPGAGGKPKIPWAEFIAASDVLLPQTYWRWTNPTTGNKQNINGGTPAAAIAKAMPAWQSKAGGKPILPMAGEVDVVTAAGIAAYGVQLAAMGVQEGHFYTDNGNIPVANLAAMQAL